jgi:hypothetical protein
MREKTAHASSCCKSSHHNITSTPRVPSCNSTPLSSPLLGGIVLRVSRAVVRRRRIVRVCVAPLGVTSLLSAPQPIKLRPENIKDGGLGVLKSILQYLVNLLRQSAHCLMLAPTNVINIPCCGQLIPTFLIRIYVVCLTFCHSSFCLISCCLFLCSLCSPLRRLKPSEMAQRWHTVAMCTGNFL